MIASAPSFPGCLDVPSTTPSASPKTPSRASRGLQWYWNMNTQDAEESVSFASLICERWRARGAGRKEQTWISTRVSSDALGHQLN